MSNITFNNLPLLLKDMETKQWKITSFFFTYNNQDYIVILKLCENRKKKFSNYIKATLEFIDSENINSSINAYLDFINVYFDDIHAMCRFFNIKSCNGKHNFMRAFNDVFSKYLPVKMDDINKKTEQERILMARRLEENNPNAIYCFNIKDNGTNKDGIHNTRSIENSNKAELLRPFLYEKYKEDLTLSFIFSDDETMEKSDAEIMKNFAQRGH